MDCEETKRLLYEFITGELGKKSQVDVEEHIKECQQCKFDAQKIRSTLALLKEAEPPSPSPDFQKRLLTRLSEIPLPPKPLLQRLRERIQIPSLDFLYMRRSYRWAAVAACLLLTLTIIRGFIAESPRDAENLQRGFQIILSEVKNPIVVETGNVNASRKRLEELIQAHKGNLVQVLQGDKKLKIVLSLEKGEEGLFFKEIQQIGKVKIEKEGYKDKNGNIVVLLREVGP